MRPLLPSRLYAGALGVVTLIAAGAGTSSQAEAADPAGGALVAAAPEAGAAADRRDLSTPNRLSVSPADSDAVAAADAAVRALSPRVRRSSHPAALRTAFQAYYNYREARPAAVRKPYLYYVDMGLDNHTRRGYVFDMERLTVIEGPFTVAHGRGSARTRDAVPSIFSNRAGSNATSLGLYLAQETYRFSGTSSGRRYSSVGLRMRGESNQFNGAARARGIVVHGAPYVTASQAGRSEGCPSMEMDRARRLLPMIANGGVVFIYSPNNTRWLASDPWIDGAAVARSGT